MTAPDTAPTPVGPVFLVDRLPALHAQLMALLRGGSRSAVMARAPYMSFSRRWTPTALPCSR